MKIINKNDNFMNDNSGSTIVTVIVAIAFVTILTSIILSTTVMNMHMKGIDRNMKDDFYHAEKALNDIYTGIGQEMSVIAGEEYDKAFSKVGTVEAGVDFGLAEASEREFRKNFITRARNKFPVDLDDLKVKLSSFITETTRSTVDSVGDIVIEKKDGTVTTPSDLPYRLRIRNLQVSSTDSLGYQSVISTDIVIYIPSADFFGSNVDITDYGIIANKGLYINGDATIKGNVYGGIHPKTEYTTIDRSMYSTDADYNAANLYGGINVKNGKVNFEGNYIVSKGNINLFGKSAGIKVGDPTISDANLPNIWFDSLKTIKKADDTFVTSDPTDTGSSIELYSNTYALNDLELNADRSTVKIAGNYYGYNDKTLPNPDKLLLGYMEKREDAESSAIIINGSSCTLDMKDINTFVLMGKAYVDFTTNGGSVETDATPVVATAEGVALKTNQQLYLVPIDFLNCPNPIGGTEFTGTYSGKFDISTSKEDIRKWFGYKYVIPKDVADSDETSADKNKSGVTDANAYKEIYKTYKVTLGPAGDTEVVYYAYLDFNDKVWIPQLDVSGKVTGYIEDTSGKPIGSGGFGPNTGASVSSKTAFFAEIMSSVKPTTPEEENIEDKKIQPSAYRLRERIEKSMKYSYFDLKKCVVGDSAHPDDAILYAKNAIVSYEKSGTEIQSNLVGNTVGMVRFADYPQNMFHRYQWLCTKLDGKESTNLKDDPGSPIRDVATDTTKDEWKASSESDAPPMSHFVMINAITSSTDTSLSAKRTEANAAGLKRTAYGDCIVKHGDFDIDSSTATVGGKTFKGIAIVDGNITVKNGYNAYGLLMATGTITIEGGDSVITYDKGLIQSRIEKEMQLVKQDEGAAVAAYKDYYLISYLSDTSRMAGDVSNTKRLYNVTPGSAIKKERIEADYNEFVQYENWKKGPQ